MKKKKILFIGITMNCAGTEKSFLSFINCLDFDRYDATLLLAKKSGGFLSMLPEKLRVIEMEEYGEHFLQSGKNAVSNVFNTFIKKKPSSAFVVLPYFLRIVFSLGNRDKVASVATKLWNRLLRYFPPVEEHYDAAVAYWGDRTMFYMLDKVRADRYITWMHFDYGNPKRDDSIYLPYFKRCGAIVNVSETVDEALKRALPEISDKCTVIENIKCASVIRAMAAEKAAFPDPGFGGVRIVTVGRIAVQKGLDIAADALAKLVREGSDVRWYVVGDGDAEYKDSLIKKAAELGVADRFILLGTTTNPYPFMRECDIYAQPSRFEGKPIAVEEAKILAKPIAVCDYLSAREQLANGKYGMIASCDGDSLAGCLAKLIKDPSLGRSFSDALSSESFSNEYEINKFYKLMGDGVCSDT